MLDRSVITSINKKSVLEEFFSGKNSHDTLFSVDDIQEFGIAVTVKDKDQDLEEIKVEKPEHKKEYAKALSLDSVANLLSEKN
jgi:dTDP-glucose pyrophosphorylase